MYRCEIGLNYPRIREPHHIHKCTVLGRLTMGKNIWPSL